MVVVKPLHLVEDRLDPRSGRLLVAAPMLVDPHFVRTIVLLLDVDDDGVLGVVLNRPSDVDVDGVLSSWADLVRDPAVVFVGGPVGNDSALAVGRLADGIVASGPHVGWRPLFDGTGLVDLDIPSGDLVPAVDAMRIYAGYAGWSPGQLAEEIAEGAWYVVEGRPTDLFAADPAALWHQVLARQRGPLAWLATYPDDPTSN
ncbi:MAG: hypothetical protein JWO46_3044 [Nocardioidaceae bacterium]|nr:hypothetical protein [Nocardioidaceae bacterium]